MSQGDRIANLKEKFQEKIIDGNKISSAIKLEVAKHVEELVKLHGLRPGLAVVLVGERKDSATYVRLKKKAATEAQFHSVDLKLEENISEEELLSVIDDLNVRDDVHGILVQVPLPSHINESKILKKIKIEKDVDGFSAINIGNLCLRGGEPPLAIPCTPAGCVELIQRSGIACAGKHAVVLGRSNIVGMPMAHLLLSMDCTVTVCHSKTKNIEEYTRQADILIAAIGKANFVRGSWLKKGAVVIDVGINSVEDSSRKRGYRLVGDVCFEEALPCVSRITPVPGGVGPMTIAMLLYNTVNLARNSIGLPRIRLRQNNYKY